MARVIPSLLNGKKHGKQVALYALLLGALISLAPTEAAAQIVNFDFDTESGSATGQIVQLLLALTVLSVAPAILLMVTGFTRVVVVLSILRRALGTNTSPPNIVIMSLAMFMTAFIMAPTFKAAWETGVGPFIDGQIDEVAAFEQTVTPFHTFMMRHVRDKDLSLFLDMSNSGPVATPEDTPLEALVPAFMISELRRAFEIGFLIYVPFIIIDMVIASVLMSMGMMMLPPMMIALPFKLIFFVLVDGWYVLVGSLVQSFGGPI
ncbi:MAG: flagellar type III secretion system pore protein FliP [Alphaproteobacteria bacterium]|nr:flagellar type III secretion system pore protein FliP [Alphaproteobacteria bacterium]